MDAGPEPKNQILVTNNIDFFEKDGMKYFKAAEINKDNNSIVTLNCCFDPNYKLTKANVMIGNVNFDINSSQGTFDLELLNSLIALSTTSLIFDYNDGKYKIYINENGNIKPSYLDLDFFETQVIKESNYMYMDDIDRMINYIIAYSSSTGYKCPLDPIVFETIEKDFKSKEKTKIITLPKRAS